MPAATPIPTVESATATPTMTATPTSTPTSEPTPWQRATSTATPTGIVLPAINQFSADRIQIDFGEDSDALLGRQRSRQRHPAHG